MARFEGGEMVGGILRELDEALARRLGMRARHLALPSLRVSPMLTSGAADLLCYSRPQWLSGEFRWTRPIFPNAGVLAARPEAAVLRKAADLRGLPVGTVRGYFYGPVEQLLGNDFMRLDAADMRANLDKLAAGRMQYAFTDRMALREMQQRRPELQLREDLVVEEFTAACALSPATYLNLADVNAAIEAMQREGEIRAILRRHGQ